MRFFLGFVVLLVLLACGLLVAPSFINWDQYKDQGLAQVKTLSGYDISIGGGFKVGFLPAPHVKASDVVVVNPAVSSEPLAKFEDLSVGVALAPLFKKQVQVSDISLVKPVFDLRVDREGKGNWLSPEVEALLAKKGDATPKSKGAAQNIEFENVEIKDGFFRFFDAGKDKEILAEDIDVDLSAKSLQGPFDGKGSLKFSGQPVAFDIETQRIKDGDLPLRLNAQYGAYGIALKGIAGISAPFDVQGETQIKLSAAALPISEDIVIEGILSANDKTAAMKDAQVLIGQSVYKGQALVDLKPLVVKAAFEGSDVVDIAKFLPAPKKGQKKVDPVVMLTEVLPKTITLPQDFTADVALKTGGFVYGQALLKGTSLKLSKEGKAFKVSLKAADIPGTGPASVDADLSFASVSQSKTGALVYSAPTLSYTVQANTQKTGDMVKAFTGKSDIPLLSDARIGKFYVKGGAKLGRFVLDESVINLDDLKLLVSGSVKQGEARPLVTAKVTANALNFDQFSKGGAGNAKADPTAAIRALSLPYDADFDITVNEATMNAQAVSGLHVKGALRPDTLKLTQLAASDFGGAAFDVSGSIGSLKALSGIDATVKGSAQDPYSVAKTFNIDSSKWPKNLGAVKVNAALKGSIESLQTDTTLSAFGGDFALSGIASQPLTNLKLTNLAARVKHSNLSQLLKNVGASAPDFASMLKPIDASANVALDGKVVSLSDIKAKLAGTDMTGALRYDGGAARPAVSGALRFGTLELVTAKGSTGGPKKPSGGSSSSGGGKWSSTPMDTGWLHAVNANFDVAGDRLIYESWDIAKPALKMVLQAGTLDISDLKGGLFGGQVALQSKISSTRGQGNPMSVSTNANISNVNIGKLATALSGSRKLQGDGTVSLTMDVAGSGLSQKALVSSLGGSAKLDGKKVVLKGFDLAGLASALLDSNKPLPRIQQLVGASSSSGETAFDTVKGEYAIQNGVVGITTMELDGPEALITSTGNADLPKWYINTIHNVTLKDAPDVAPFDVAIKGPLDNPGNTFGKGLFDTYLNEKLGEKIQDLVGDDVGNVLQQFGIIPKQQQKPAPVPANDNTEPAAGDEATPEAAQPVQEQPKQKSPEEEVQDALENVIKGLF